MQNIHQILGHQTFPGQGSNAVHRSILNGQSDSVIGEHQVHDGLTDHTQLHQTGVGVRIQVCFRLLAKLCQNRKICFQKIKIGFHILRFPKRQDILHHNNVIITRNPRSVKL